MEERLSQFSGGKNGWWGRPIVNEILGYTNPVPAKTPIFLSIFARSASAVTPSEKSSSRNGNCECIAT